MTRGTALFTALVVVLAASGCKSCRGEPTSPRVQRKTNRCSHLPGPKNTRLPIFYKPFVGDHPAASLFDHEVPGAPYPFDESGSEITFCDTELIGLHEGHEGYDWLPPAGTPVLAVQSGVVIKAGTEPPFFCPMLKREVENQLVIELLHPPLGGEVFSTTYRHVGKILVEEGDEVRPGQQIALSGGSGCSVGDSLHFHVMRRSNTKTGKPTFIDPYGWEGDEPDPWARHKDGTASLYLWKDGEAPTLKSKAEFPKVVEPEPPPPPPPPPAPDAGVKPKKKPIKIEVLKGGKR